MRRLLPDRCATLQPLPCLASMSAFNAAFSLSSLRICSLLLRSLIRLRAMMNEGNRAAIHAAPKACRCAISPGLKFGVVTLGSMIPPNSPTPRTMNTPANMAATIIKPMIALRLSVSFSFTFASSLNVAALPFVYAERTGSGHVLYIDTRLYTYPYRRYTWPCTKLQTDVRGIV